MSNYFSQNMNFGKILIFNTESEQVYWVNQNTSNKNCIKLQLYPSQDYITTGEWSPIQSVADAQKCKIIQTNTNSMKISNRWNISCALAARLNDLYFVIILFSVLQDLKSIQPALLS